MSDPMKLLSELLTGSGAEPVYRHQDIRPIFVEQQERIAELERDRRDMAMLIRRLLCRLRNDENCAKIRQQTSDYLLRKGLGGSPLRAEKERPAIK